MELISRERIMDLTPRNPYDRFPDGRPRVPDDILERMRLVTTEEAWSVLRGHGYDFQFEGNWFNIHPERILVGRAVTGRYVPKRPDLHEIVEDEGQRHGRIGGQNSWIIDTLVKDDVVVIELFGKVVRGTFTGDNLSTSIVAHTGGTGMVVDGGMRDYQRVMELPTFTAFIRGLDPTGIEEVTLVEINGPVRIGQATCMPGDIVLGTPTGVVFIPPELALEVVERSEDVRQRDYWGKLMLSQGKYTPGEIDRKWPEYIETDYQQWRASQSGE